MRRTSFASESESSQHPASEGALAERPLFVGFELTKVRGRALADPRSRPAAPAPARSPDPGHGARSRGAAVRRVHDRGVRSSGLRRKCSDRIRLESRDGRRASATCAGSVAIRVVIAEDSVQTLPSTGPTNSLLTGFSSRAWRGIRSRGDTEGWLPSPGLSERGSPTRKETKTLGFPLTLEGCKSQRPCLAWPHLKIRTKMMMIRIRTTTPPPMYIDSPFLFGE